MKSNQSALFDTQLLKEKWWGSPKLPCSPESEEMIEQSHLDPSSFWSSLFLLREKMIPFASKSLLGEKYDFYHDCILRHPESHIAINCIDKNGFAQSWTYKKVHRAVNFQVKQWSKQGVKPGQPIAIVLPLGIHFFIALLTALRLGLTICYLPSDTPYLSLNHLASLVGQLQPLWLIAQKKELGGGLDKYSKVVMETLEEEEQACDPISQGYPAAQVMQISLALHRQTPFSLVPLTAQETYLHALRDGLIVFDLHPEAIYPLILSCPLRTQPCSTLMTLLSGATLLYVENEGVIQDPSFLKNEKYHLLGINASLEKLLSKRPVSFGKQLKGYYKSPLQLQGLSWKSLVQLNKLEETPSFQVLLDNSFGGSLFFSKPLLGDLTPFIKASLGLPWELKNLNGGGPSLSAFGQFSPTLSLKENNQLESNFITSKMETHLILSSVIKPCKEGITIPVDKIEQSVAQLPFVENCLHHSIPKASEIASFQTALLIFTDPLKNDIPNTTKEEWIQQVQFQISADVGSAFLPDRIEFYPLMPSMKQGKIDRERSGEQFMKGQLSKKRDSQLHQLISILKKFATEAAQSLGGKS